VEAVEKPAVGPGGQKMVGPDLAAVGVAGKLEVKEAREVRSRSRPVL
jgi:hypothetical protein